MGKNIKSVLIGMGCSAVFGFGFSLSAPTTERMAARAIGSLIGTVSGGAIAFGVCELLDRVTRVND